MATDRHYDSIAPALSQLTNVYIDGELVIDQAALILANRKLAARNAELERLLTPEPESRPSSRQTPNP